MYFVEKALKKHFTHLFWSSHNFYIINLSKGVEHCQIYALFCFLVFWFVLDFDRCCLIKEAKARNRGTTKQTSGDVLNIFTPTAKIVRTNLI